MQVAVLREPFDRRDLVAVGAKGGNQAAMNWDAVEPYRACAAIAGVATFLDPEPSHLAQESSQALSWPRLFREGFAVDQVTHGCTLLREFAPDLFGEIKSHVLAILRRAMNVVEKFRNFALEAGAQIVGIGKFRKLEPMRPLGRGGNHQHEDSIARIERAGQQRRRSPEVSQRYPAEARFACAAPKPATRYFSANRPAAARSYGCR